MFMQVIPAAKFASFLFTVKKVTNFFSTFTEANTTINNKMHAWSYETITQQS